jgi:serpin B
MKKAFAVIGALGILLCSQAFALDDVAAVARGNTAFALDLYGRLKDTGKNTFLSPYSISTALAMAYAGARGNTEKQMAEVLHFDLGQGRLHPTFGALQARIASFGEKEGVRLDIANALWPRIDYPFLPAYLVLLKEHYGVSVRTLDYRKDAEGARKTINLWAEGKTQGRIKDLIPPRVLNVLTRLVLTIAIYFKGR